MLERTFYATVWHRHHEAQTTAINSSKHHNQSINSLIINSGQTPRGAFHSITNELGSTRRHRGLIRGREPQWVQHNITHTWLHLNITGYNWLLNPQADSDTELNKFHSFFVFYLHTTCTFQVSPVLKCDWKSKSQCAAAGRTGMLSPSVCLSVCLFIYLPLTCLFMCLSAHL